MERRDLVIGLLLVGGGAFAIHHNREAISERLGFDDLDPATIKAIVLAKQEFTFDRSRPNGLVVDEWLREGTVQKDGETWTAQQLAGQQYRVVCRFRDRSGPRRHEFDVDIASSTVRVREIAAPPR